MSKSENGIYEVINNEGAICNINTTDRTSSFYGESWANVCESYLFGTVISGEIEKFRFRSNRGVAENSNPTGFVVCIGSDIEAFLPMALTSKYRAHNEELSNERIAIMIEEFDPKSKSVVVREIKVTDTNFNISLVNDALSLIGLANRDSKFVLGTIIGEAINKNNNRAGYKVSINGVEAFLPCSQSLIPLQTIQNVIGHNVLCSVEEIDIERMSIILSAKTPYERLLQSKDRPELKAETECLIGWVTAEYAYAFLPNNILGLISKNLYQNKVHADWVNLTGRMVSCIPFKRKVWNEPMQDYQYLIALI